MSKRTYTKQKLEAVVKESLCKREVMNKLGLSSNGSGGYRSLNKALIQWKIDISHFKPREAASLSRKLNNNSSKYTLEELLKIWEYQIITSSKLKQRLYNQNILERICQLCGQGELWHGKVMSLRLDHINGNPLDNRLENLRIICPNCDATLDTYCGKNIKKKAIKKKCITCKEIIKDSKAKLRTRKHCNTCIETGKYRIKTRIVKRPGYEQLKQEIEEDGYSAIGRKYNVSDNAIRKWIKSYHKQLNIKEDLPKKKK